MKSSVIGILAGICSILFGFILLFAMKSPEIIEFGGDFYTEIYEEVAYLYACVRISAVMFFILAGIVDICAFARNVNTDTPVYRESSSKKWLETLSPFSSKKKDDGSSKES